MFCLKNEELTLEIASHGAEMKSLKDNQTGQEYLWDADPAFWKRTSPVLFLWLETTGIRRASMRERRIR